MLDLFRRHQARVGAERLAEGDVLGAAAAAQERHGELVGNQLERLRDEGRLGCAAGCSHCCNLEVNASFPELARLRGFVEERFSPEERAALLERLRTHRPGSPCALLVDGLCSAYEARPLACRGWNSADSEACRLAALAPSRAPTIPVHRKVRDTALALAESLRDAAADRGLDSAALDLRLGLLGLLEGGEEAVERWLDGERLPPDWHSSGDLPPAAAG